MKTKRNKKFINSITFAIALLLIGVNANWASVMAGSDDVVFDKSSFAEELNTSKWNNPDDDVQVKDKKILFNKKSTADTRVITRSAAKVSEQYDKLLSGTYKMKMIKLPEGKRFILAFGLENMESFYEEPESLEIFFVNDGGLQVGVAFYDENGEKAEVVSGKSYGLSMGQSFTVNVEISSDMQLKIAVNGQAIFNEKSSVDLEGRMGFLQTGSCQAEISDVDMCIYRYETPENCNITEDFENHTINVNALTSKMINTCNYYPAGVHVEDYNGSKVLMFRNVGCGYIGTMYSYSNFEITFDIPYMLHSSLLREDGTIKAPANYGFALAYGGDSQDYDFFGFESAADALVFSSTDVYSYKNSSQKISFAEGKFYDKDANEGFSVKLTVKDTIATLEMKAISDSQYKEIMSYKVGETTPTGYIHIWSTGQANFAIDNLSIVNKDEGAKLIDVGFQSGIVEKQPDWEYQPMNAPYLEKEVENNLDWRTYLPLIYAAAIGVLLVVGTFIVVGIQKSEKRRN